MRRGVTATISYDEGENDMQSRNAQTRLPNRILPRTFRSDAWLAAPAALILEVEVSPCGDRQHAAALCSLAGATPGLFLYVPPCITPLKPSHIARDVFKMNLLLRLLGFAFFCVAFGHETFPFGPEAQIPFGPAPRPHESPSRPNIVFVLTDDQDLHLQSLDYMPHVQRHLIQQGTSFRRHYCTTALCCPSRATLWTGKAAHNTNVTNVTPPYGRC